MNIFVLNKKMEKINYAIVHIIKEKDIYIELTLKVVKVMV